MVEDVEELKDVFRKVADKLLATEKICIALNFQIWVVVMSGYYLLIALL